MKTLKTIIHTLLAPLDTEVGRLSNIPNFIIRRTRFMSLNAVGQAVADVVLEVLLLLGLFSFKIPLRVEFLFLTLLSTVIAYLTLKGMREGSLDITKNTLIIGLIVESSLVLADVYLLVNTHKDLMSIFLVRLPFLLFTASNIYIISNILWRRHKVKKNRPNYQF